MKMVTSEVSENIMLLNMLYHTIYNHPDHINTKNLKLLLSLILSVIFCVTFILNLQRSFTRYVPQELCINFDNVVSVHVSTLREELTKYLIRVYFIKVQLYTDKPVGLR